MSKQFTDLFQKQKNHFLSFVKHEKIADRRNKLRAIKTWMRRNESLIISSIAADFNKSTEEIKFGEIRIRVIETLDAQKKGRLSPTLNASI